MRFSWKPIVGLLALSFAAVNAVPAAASDEKKADEPPAIEASHIQLYKNIAPSVVGISDGAQRGTGVVIDAGGLILTSTTSVREGKNPVTLYLPGFKKAKAEKVAVVASKELVILKTDAAGLKAVELGDSDKVAVGQTSYVIGDSFNSIFSDGQPAMSVGTVSGIYPLSELRFPGTAYVGRVIESSAAVNPNQDGAPLLDADGKLIGVVTLNFSAAKFTGLAIPINELKPTIDKVRKGETVNDEDLHLEQIYTLGIVVRDTDGGAMILYVAEKSPAERAGIAVGDILVRIDKEEVKTYRALRRYLLKAKTPSVSLTLKRLGESIELPVVIKEKPTKEY